MEFYNNNNRIEKLFSQIFDRKNDIINKAKQQADSFSQHLASKLLIDGITPPPCLLNPNLHFSDPSIHQDFKKDLLSELLLPHPQPTVVNRGGFFPPYSQPIVLDGKEELEARVFGETHGPTFLSDNNGDQTRCALNDPDQGVSSISLQGQIAVRTSDNVTEPTYGETLKGLSLEKLVSDRGCNAVDKSTPEFNCTVPFAFELDQSIISPQVQNKARISSNVASRDQSVYKIQRSRSRQKALELRKTNEKSFSTQQSDKIVRGVCFNEDEIFTNVSNVRQPHQDGELLASARYSESTSHMCEEDQALAECLSKEKDDNTYSGRMTRSRISHNQSADESKSKLDITLEVAQVDGEDTIRLRNSSVEGIAKNIHLSKSSGQRVTRSKSGPSEKFPLNYSNGHGECHSQKDPSSEYTVSHPNINDIIKQKAKPECPIGTEVILERSVKIQAVGSESKLDCAGPSIGFEGFDSRPSSNCMIVNPKTLDFDEIEKINSIEVNSPMVETESLNKSVGKRCESAQSHASLGKITCSSPFAKSVEKQSSEKNIMNQITEPLFDPEKHVMEEDHVMKSAQSHASLGKVTCTCSFAKSVEKQSVEKNIMNQITEPSDDSEKHVLQEEQVMKSAQSHASLGKITCSSYFAKSVEKQSAEKNIMNQITEPSDDSEKHVLEKQQVMKAAQSNASLGKITCNSSFAKSVEKQSAEKNILNQITEPSGVLEEEHVMTSATIRDVDDNSLFDGKIHNSPIHHEEQTRSSNSGEDIDMLNYQKDEDNSIRNQQVQKCELSCNKMVSGEATTISSSIDNLNVCQVSSSKQPEADDASTSVLDDTRCTVEETQNVMSRKSGVVGGLTSSGSMLVHEKSSMRNSGFLARSAVESLRSDGKNFTSKELGEQNFLEESPMLGKKLRSAAANTWPKHKRRKIESQETKSISAGVSFMEKESHYIGASLNNRNLSDTGTNLGISLQFESSPSSHKENAEQSDASKSPDLELHPEILTQETDSFSEMPIEQNELAFKEKIQSERVFLCTPDRECVSFSASSLSTGEGKDPEISSGLNATTRSTVLDESLWSSENNCEELVHFEDVLMESTDELNDYKRTLLETRPYIVENGSHHLFPVVSPQDEHLTTSNSDQIMPEFEGFIIGEENNGQSHIVGDSFDSLELPASSVERASVLEQLCKSAVLHTPLNHFSATHKFHRTPDVYFSVPTLNANAEDERLSASQESRPDRIPFSDTFFGQNLTTPTSPVSKLWTEFHPSLIDRSASQSLSSENKLSLNPELVCFPIEEDPSSSEEREDKDDMENSTPEDICSGSIHCGDKRNPLTDITQANGDPLPPLSVAKVSRDRSSLDSVVSEVNFTGTHGGVRRNVDRRQSKRRTATNETKKKLTLSTSTNFMGIGKESLNNGNRKPNLSRKPSLRKDGPSMTGRESKQNNIISNISSFVPLVQQKQAAALITGKRDVKVKALEAAEAARRLEEKKDNERKLKKEALKLEQARVKQESLRQAELNRKKKEDELKKKEADVAARKRLREEEEKKEKERKRRRFEGKRQQQRAQDGKLRAQKLEKELPIGVINAKLNSGTVNADALQKPQKVIGDVDKGDGKGVKKPFAESVVSKSLENDVRQAVVESFEAFGHSRTSIEVTKTSRGKSYEISPYQSSDDEDDEDDEISPKKFVPAWASKKSLALIVSSQQNVDPDILFAPGTFCSVEEVSGLEAYNKK